ncbi:response regulator [Diaphorobacter sp. J5-51]|uniref:response regulator n=1 Tax=Diaphorobacter sp. J5-51 TaxID=680496 RepID=UPI000643076B|nr:response regulator [Diaphorobacter sp. J5-51]KLR59731.1 chemotaxis protein CheY [Diaphorobacter sp. J5-51]
MRILYVEDNCELRDTIGLLMEGEGRTVVTCATAEEALQRDAALPHDVVVSDVSLPGMSGLDLCRHLLASNPQRWVVLCSGYPLEHGVGTLGTHVRSLLKPFELEELEELLDVIASHLQSASPA